MTRPEPIDATSSEGEGDIHEIVEDLHRLHYRSLVRLAGLMVGSREVAEEIVQDAFVTMLSVVDRIDDASTHGAYLRSIVMNSARSRLRRRSMKRRHATLQQQRLGPSVDNTDTDYRIRLREDQLEVAAALQELASRQRECIILRFYGELTEEEIASTLGISRGAVKTHLSRAKTALAKQLESRR